MEETTPGNAAGHVSPRAWFAGFAASLVLFGLLAVFHAYCSLTYRPGGGGVPYVVGFDENSYYAYVHSIFFDRDVNLRNEYEFIAQTQPSYTSDAFVQRLRETPGNPFNEFNAGIGYAAIPAMGVARLLAAVRQGLAGEPALSTFSPFYVLAYYAGNIAYGMGALLIAWLILRRWFSAPVASVACWAAALCGPYFYYVLYAPGMSHMPSAFFGACAVWCWLRWRGPEAGGAPGRGFAASAYPLLTGWCVGFATAIRPYSAPLGILVIEPLATAAIVCLLDRRRSAEARTEGLRALGRLAIPTLLALVGGVLGFLPQMLAWHAQHGQWLVNTTDYRFHLVPPNFLRVLFGRRHGLFFWAPAYLVAIGGLVIALRNLRRPATVMLLVFAGVTFMYGNWWYYWLGVSFGMRGYVDFPCVFAFGFAAAIATATARFGPRTVPMALEVVVLFFIVNLHLGLAFRGGVITVDGPLYWLDTVSHGRKYKEQLHRDWTAWTDFRPENRVSVFR